MTKLRFTILLCCVSLFIFGGCSTSDPSDPPPNNQQNENTGAGIPNSPNDNNDDESPPTPAFPDEWTEIDPDEVYPEFTYNGLEPSCSACPTEDGTTDPKFKFFIKGGSSNNLVVYFMGGGACWNKGTCITTPLYFQEVTTSTEDLAEAKGIFQNQENNPFSDWNYIYIPYCTGDVHLGAGDADYAGIFDAGSKIIRHRGAVNFHVVLKWMEDTLEDNPPDKIFVTGSSAGSYGPLVHFPHIRDVFRSADMYVMGDAGIGVVGADFQQQVAEKWEVQLPHDLVDFDGDFSNMSTEVMKIAIANANPDIRVAEYTTDADIVQIMFWGLGLNIVDFLLKSVSLQLSNDWEDEMYYTLQDISTHAPNFKYYIGSGTDHTIMTSEKLYSENTGKGPEGKFYFIDFIKDMLDPDEDWDLFSNYYPSYVTPN